jgi:hypothetical protein
MVTKQKPLTDLCLACKELKLNTVAWVRERTIPTELPQLVKEVSDNFCG